MSRLPPTGFWFLLLNSAVFCFFKLRASSARAGLALLARLRVALFANVLPAHHLSAGMDRPILTSIRFRGGSLVHAPGALRNPHWNVLHILSNV
jgi:hypothetical protein